MNRKAITEEVQTNILLKSRRRCCLCFWLKGDDEVKKGQIAHLDGKPDNAAEDNLVFLCLDHHDEYDGKTRIAKGLREQEVKRWRDELYKEMEYRFRLFKKRGFELTLIRFLKTGTSNFLTAEFRLKNVGEVEVRSPNVSIRLPTGVGGKPMGRVKQKIRVRDMKEVREDLFEPNGRIANIKLLGMLNPVLMPDHSVNFKGLSFDLSTHRLGLELSLEYRVDAEGMAPLRGVMTAKIPDVEGAISLEND